MPSTFTDQSAPHFHGTLPPRPAVLEPPKELSDQVAAERAKVPPEVYTDQYAKLVLDDRTLAYYFGGQDVAYRSLPNGVEVLAVGADEIGALVKGRSQEELLSFKIKRA